MKVILIQLSYKRFVSTQGFEPRNSTGGIGDLQLCESKVFEGYCHQPDKTSASFSADG